MAITVLSKNSTANRSTPFSLVGTNSTNATLVASGRRKLTMLSASNVNAAACYVKLYDLAVGPTVGTTVPVLRILVPGSTAGGTVVLSIPDDGIEFKNGIGFATTTGVADSDTTAVAANEVIVNGAFSDV